MDIGAFRTTFQEFSDTSVYSNQLITFYATLAEAQVPQCVWKTQWQTGVYLYVAHNLVIEKQNRDAAAIGGTPGLSGGIANTKTVGSATIGFDAATQSEEGAGWWNRTTYGQQFYRLVRVFGAGAIQFSGRSFRPSAGWWGR